MNYSILEKVEICTDIAKKLKTFKGEHGAVNLFNDNYSFVPILKQLFQEYIHGDVYLKGELDFVEIDRKIEYHLPLTKNHNPLFVIRNGLKN
jgi:hypothetical protein